MYVPTEQQEQVQQAAQVMLALLSDESVSVPGNLLEGVVSGKSLLRAIVQGSLVVCTEEPSAAEAKTTNVRKKVARKKGSK